MINTGEDITPIKLNFDRWYNKQRPGKVAQANKDLLYEVFVAAYSQGYDKGREDHRVEQEHAKELAEVPVQGLTIKYVVSKCVASNNVICSTHASYDDAAKGRLALRVL